MGKTAAFLATAFFTMAIAVAGCATRHEVDVKPVEIKPIHITIDVNIRVDKALDNFFDDIDAADSNVGKAPQ